MNWSASDEGPLSFRGGKLLPAAAAAEGREQANAACALIAL